MIKEVTRGNTATESIGFTLENCCNCGIPFFMPTYHYKRLLANKGESFYCPNGHGQHYTGPTEADKLKQQLENERLRKEREIEDLQNRMLDEMNEKIKLQKQVNRMHKGVCPCCNRSFENLANHIKTQHPEIIGKEKYVHPKPKKQINKPS